MADALRLVHDALAPLHARRWIAQRCHQWGCDELADNAALMLTELVTNVYLHAGTDCLIQAAYAQPTLSVAVSDENGFEVRHGAVPDSAEDGRGLSIVAALADAWGTRRDGGSKRVWFALSASNRTHT
jgi:anti-sigma regulatory factor (Ser/Thr protein kinase)